MANIRLNIPSFNAGELSPLLGARFAVEKVQSGCRRLRNFIPHVHGPAFRRPGMEYMGPSAGDGAKSKLVGFNFSTTTGFVLEFHPNGLQVWSNGEAVPLRNPVPLPYTESEVLEIQTAQVNDVTYIAHPNHAPRRLVRYADDDWRLEAIDWDWPALGDENVREDEIATPTVAELLSVPTYQWKEFEMPDVAYTFEVLVPDTTGATKKARLYKWSLTEETWVLKKSFTWTTVGPSAFTDTVQNAGTWRMTYEGPEAPTTIQTTWGGGSYGSTLNASVFQPEIEEPVTVPAGEWQTTVVCPNEIPEGAQLWIQKKNHNDVWNDYKRLTLRAGKTTITRGATLTAATEFRFRWVGRAMEGGTAKVESIVFPVSADITLAVDGINGTDRTMTASSPLFQEGHVGSYWQITHRREKSHVRIVPDGGDLPTLAAAESPSLRVSGRWDVFSYGIWNTTLYLEKYVGGTWETLRSWDSNKDRNVAASGTEDEEVELRLRISDGTAEASSEAAVPRFLLEAADARVYGLVKITALGALNDDGKASSATVDVINTLHSTDPTALWTEGAWSGVKGYPRCVTLHGQRLWFGGTETEPLRLWGSVTADFQNFRRSSLDDASVSFTPAAQQSNALQWMVSHGTDLVLGTNGDEWTLAGGTDQGPITPTSVQMQRRSAYGSAYIPALLLGEVVVFVQRGGRKLRQVAPRADGIVWSAADLTVLAEHVTVSGVTQIATMNFPASILWAVTNDGRLLGMTFEQEQNVFGWHVHNTDGFVESVAVVYGADSDEVWLQVRRGTQRSIERLDPLVFARQFDTPERLIYLDAATRIELSEPSGSLTGLDYLEGQTVSVLGDGAELSPVRVIGGVAQLEQEVSTAIVGLPFTSELQPMRQEIPLRDGTAQHRHFRLSRVGLYLHDSLGGQVADSPESRFETLNMRRVVSSMDAAPPLFTGEIESALEAHTRDNVDVIVKQSAPLPFNIGSLMLSLDVYGDQ